MLIFLTCFVCTCERSLVEKSELIKTKPMSHVKNAKINFLYTEHKFWRPRFLTLNTIRIYMIDQPRIETFK